MDRSNPHARVETFNRRWPVGTAVLYATSPGANPRAATTRSEAWVLGGHTPVVLVDGLSGAVAMDALVIIPPASLPTGEQGHG